MLSSEFFRDSAALLRFFASDLTPQPDIALYVAHERFAVVALRANQQLAEVVHVVLTVGYCDVLARPRILEKIGTTTSLNSKT